MKTTLHHFAYNIRPNTLELVVEFFEKLGCEVSYQEDGARWCLMRQKDIPVRIQIIETDDEIVTIDKKINTHICFLSDNPKKVIGEIEIWAQNNNLSFEVGKWSDEMIWFDLSDMFVNFVIEIMDVKVI